MAVNQSNINTAPPCFPDTWAAEWGEDHYGLWQALIYKQIRVVFRWIKSGGFQMGSPIDEAEREPWAKETQHQVILTKGFWLAETTVTQAFWQAVMGNNPSHFSDSGDYLDRPVEQVSWDDAQQFIKALRSLLQAPKLQPPEFLAEKNNPLQLRLPFEAEWEYACRAGTETAFSFGENITSEQVNFNGSYPYNNAEKGEYREETVKVASLLCNDWGLCEMHGNVWEWCEDYYQRDLGSSSITNPIGAKAGSERVIRGGSWYYDGRYVRSAMRFNDSPGNRNGNIGLRLAIGQSFKHLQKQAV